MSMGIASLGTFEAIARFIPPLFISIFVYKWLGRGFAPVYLANVLIVYV